MENNNKQTVTQEEMIQAIYENTYKTMNYMKWQLYITVILIVLPILSILILLPFVMRSLGSLSAIYGGGLLEY